MDRRQNYDKRFTTQHVDADTGPRNGPAHEGDVEKPQPDLLEERHTVTFAKHQVHGGVCEPQSAEHIRHHRKGRRTEKADAQQRGVTCRSPACRLAGMRHLHERPATRIEQCQARGRELDTPTIAAQQLAPEILFQPPNLLAEGGLRDAKPLGRLAEVQGLRDRHEVTESPDVEHW
jgi:hypothetical protein